MNAKQRMDPFAKVNVEKLVNPNTCKCRKCGSSIKPDKAVGHYKVCHLEHLTALAKRIEESAGEKTLAKDINEKAGEKRTRSQTLNQGNGVSSVAPANPPQVNTPSTSCETSGSVPQQRPATDSANVAPPGSSVKQETFASDGDDDVLVTFDLSAAPYFVEPQGVGYRLHVHDTKNLVQENINFLLSILGPPEHAPAADADPQMKFHPLNTGGERIEVADTGLLTVAQLASLRRVISGTTDYVVVGGQPQNRANVPIPQQPPVPFKAPRAANAKAKRGRGRPPKDPNAPKRARSAYEFFLQDFRSRIAGSAVKPQEATRAAALEWNMLSGAQRTPFLQMASVDKARNAAERARYLNGP